MLQQKVFLVYVSETGVNYSTHDDLMQFKDRLPEHERLSILKYHRPQDRRIAVASYLLQRSILSSLLNMNSLSIPIIRNIGTKPRLSCWNHSTPLDWNVSHDGEMLAIGLTTFSNQIGIDIMELDLPLRHATPYHLISSVKTQLTVEEYSWINEIPDDMLLRFFIIWTAKEAYLKACGTGIQYDLSRLNIIPCNCSYCLTTPYLNKESTHMTFSPLIKMKLFLDGSLIDNCHLFHHRCMIQLIPGVLCVCLLHSITTVSQSLLSSDYPHLQLKYQEINLNTILEHDSCMDAYIKQSIIPFDEL